MNHELSFREKNIIFIGFMGVGKTSVGKALAKKMYRDFIDIDEAIEADYGMSTSQIFQTIGEKQFREKEKEKTLHYCNQKLKVISLGGGAFLQNEIRETCLSKCIVFHLDISWEAWKKRMAVLMDSRPLLQNKSMAEIKELFYERQKIYESYHSKINMDDLEFEDVANLVMESLRTAWELYDIKH